MLAKVLVLDAMGVIYSVGDDVVDLLCPFVREHGGERAPRTVRLRRRCIGRLRASPSCAD
jgi:hypothetical protein